MRAWLKALAFSRRAQLVPVVFDKNGTLVVPAGVSSVGISGYGARGRDASTSDRWRIQETTTRYFASGGAQVEVNTTRYSSVSAGNYCDPRVTLPNGDQLQNCTISTRDGEYNSPATTGASATGLGKTFPGSYGNTTPAVTTFPSVPVTGGASYNIVVPAGGLITVTYYL